mmetsp:Transcript_45603/g.108513  ORF Transcript_45603/g.108513 Transcript_45603/m.108513 type:complete len:1222 (-) Transcript_45603:45-3710(-)
MASCKLKCACCSLPLMGLMAAVFFMGRSVSDWRNPLQTANGVFQAALKEGKSWGAIGATFEPVDSDADRESAYEEGEALESAYEEGEAAAEAEGIPLDALTENEGGGSSTEVGEEEGAEEAVTTAAAGGGNFVETTPGPIGEEESQTEPAVQEPSSTQPVTQATTTPEMSEQANQTSEEPGAGEGAVGNEWQTEGEEASAGGEVDEWEQGEEIAPESPVESGNSSSNASEVPVDSGEVAHSIDETGADEQENNTEATSSGAAENAEVVEVQEAEVVANNSAETEVAEDNSSQAVETLAVSEEAVPEANSSSDAEAAEAQQSSNATGEEEQASSEGEVASPLGANSSELVAVDESTVSEQNSSDAAAVDEGAQASDSDNTTSIANSSEVLTSAEGGNVAISEYGNASNTAEARIPGDSEEESAANATAENGTAPANVTVATSSPEDSLESDTLAVSPNLSSALLSAPMMSSEELLRRSATLETTSKSLQEAVLDAQCVVHAQAKKVMLQGKDLPQVVLPDGSLRRRRTPAVLCRVLTQSLPKRPPPVGPKFALLQVVADFEELMESDYSWFAFVNKLSFATRTERAMFLWIGGKVSKGETYCGVEKPSNSFLRPYAEAMLLQTVPAVKGLFALETNSYIWSYKRLEAYFALDSDAKYVFPVGGSSDSKDFIGTSGHLLSNGIEGQSLARAWWAFRCGADSKLALWFATFALLQLQTKSKFTFDQEHFRIDAKNYTLAHLRTMTSQMQDDVSCKRKSKGCWDKETGELNGPLRVGSLLVLPPTEMKVDDSLTLLPIRQPRAGGVLDTLTCHVKHSAGTGTCRGNTGNACARGRCSLEQPLSTSETFRLLESKQGWDPKTARALKTADLQARCRVSAADRKLQIRSKDDKWYNPPNTLPPGPVLCRVLPWPRNKFDNDAPPLGKKLAVLEVVSDTAYLMNDDYTWWAFVNKLHYAQRTWRPMFLWIGGEPPSLEFPYCKTRLSNHYLKVLAELCLLRTLPVTGVVYMDADVWINSDSPLDVKLESYLEISASAHVFFTMGRTRGEDSSLLNSGIHIVRNTAEGRDFVQRWWELRCGDHDQLAVWLLAFEILGNLPGNNFFTFSRGNFADYETAHKYVFTHFRENLQRLGLSSGRWICPEGKCFNKHLQLVEPLQLGPLLILHEKPIKVANAPLPALRHDIDPDRPTFVCHVHAKESQENGCKGKVETICKNHGCDFIGPGTTPR